MHADTKLTSKTPLTQVAAELASYFHRNGCVRRQNSQRLAREGYMGYKKGDEVRLTACSRKELARLRGLLKLAGFRPGRPHMVGRRHRQPLYGRDAVRRFLDLVGAGGRAKPHGRADADETGKISS